tara:strand:+ start:15797 stop:16300 length:504 start_codon:yes stop_codon:yes gene_type:complete
MDNSHALMWFSKLFEHLDWDKIQENGFINLYYGDMSVPVDFINTRQLIMLFNADNISLDYIIPAVSKNLELSSIYYRDNLCKVVFQIPEDWNDYYDKILKGEFSQINQGFLTEHMSDEAYVVVRNISRKTASGLAFCRVFYSLDIPEEAEEYWSKVSQNNFIHANTK